MDIDFQIFEKRSHEIKILFNYLKKWLLNLILFLFSNITASRNKYKEKFFRKHGVKLGFMSPFIKATAYALQD